MCSEWGTPRTRAPHLLLILATGNYVQFLSYFDMLPHKWGPLRKYIRILLDILAPISGNFFAKGLRPTILVRMMSLLCEHKRHHPSQNIE